MTLEEARLALDKLDEQIAGLFYERMAVVDEIGAIKATENTPVHRPERERQVTQRLLEIHGLKYERELLQLYEAIFSISRQRQEEMKKHLNA